MFVKRQSALSAESLPQVIMPRTNSVYLSIKRGEIRGLLGPNGAGKTTLFNVLAGLYRAEEGKVEFNGKPLRISKPHKVVEAGISRTFQNIRLFHNMTALENVMIGRHVRMKSGVFGAILRTRRCVQEEREIHEAARFWLNYVGIGRFAEELAKNLSYGDQRRLEIAPALATEPLEGQANELLHNEQVQKASAG